jgi:hypothetical protein
MATSKPFLRIQYKKDLIKTVNSFKKDWMSGELQETAIYCTNGDLWDNLLFITSENKVWTPGEHQILIKWLWK